MTEKKSDTQHDKKAEDFNIPFEDNDGMFGTSPVEKELSDEEVEYLTSKTAPRVRLSRSKRKISMYISLFMIVLFIARLVYYRTAPVTGYTVPPIFGLNEMGLTITCCLLSFMNLFLVAPEDQSIRNVVRFIGTGLPLIIIAALYLLPATLIHKMTWFMY